MNIEDFIDFKVLFCSLSFFIFLSYIQRQPNSFVLQYDHLK